MILHPKFLSSDLLPPFRPSVSVIKRPSINAEALGVNLSPPFFIDHYYYSFRSRLKLPINLKQDSFQTLIYLLNVFSKYRSYIRFICFLFWDCDFIYSTDKWLIRLTQSSTQRLFFQMSIQCYVQLVNLVQKILLSGTTKWSKTSENAQYFCFLQMMDFGQHYQL